MDWVVFCVIFVIGAASAKVPLGKQNFPRLRGVNRSGTEYKCMQSQDIFDSPNDEDTIDKMKTWKINVVRVPMNEGCWLKRYVPHDESSGDNYKTEMEKWIRLLRKKDLYVILELHWTEGLYKTTDGKEGCKEEGAKCQKPMPNFDTSPTFWKEVANMFKDDEGIIFDLFNEPFPEGVIADKEQAWKCWESGHDECKPWFTYDVAGMKDLVGAVRETGAKNLIMLGGLNYANDMEKWMEHVPKDDDNLAASMHNYNFNSCTTKDCWEAGIGKISETYPVIVGEIGQNDCKHDYIDRLMDYLEQKEISYLAWTWYKQKCEDGPSLITEYDGTASGYGVGFKNYLEKVAT